MRTTTTSITKTCPACGAVNTLVIMTAGVPPRWRIGCSGCGHDIVGTSGPSAVERTAERSAEIVRLPVPAVRRSRELRPAGQGRSAVLLPAISERRRHETARRLRVIRASAHASTGVSLAAVCGIVLVAFVLEREPAPAAAPSGLHVMEGTQLLASDSDPPRALAGQRPPLYLYPRLSVPSGPAIPGVPESATAAAGDPGIASLVDFKRRMPDIYPDPRAGMMVQEMAARDEAEIAVAAAAEDEEALALSAGKRREVQRRLQLARHDPRAIDGVFGPMTRTAIAEWQSQAGLPATGYLDRSALALLVEQTQADYRAWRTAERAREEREQVAAAGRRPLRRPTAMDRCARQGSGEVAYGQSVRCDFKGLRESFGSLRENLAGLFDRPEPSPWRRQADERRRPGGA